MAGSSTSKTACGKSQLQSIGALNFLFSLFFGQTFLQHPRLLEVARPQPGCWILLYFIFLSTSMTFSGKGQLPSAGLLDFPPFLKLFFNFHDCWQHGSTSTYFLYKFSQRKNKHDFYPVQVKETPLKQMFSDGRYARSCCKTVHTSDILRLAVLYR